MLRRHAFRRATYHRHARAQMIFHCTVMRQMPCFPVFGAYATVGDESRRADETRARCTNLSQKPLKNGFDST